MIRRFPHTLRRGGRGGSAGSSLLAVPAGAFISMTGDGFTEVSGDVASIDGVGSTLSRLSPAVNRPLAVDVGSLRGAQIDRANSEYLVSDAAVDATLGVFFTMLFRVDELVASDRYFDLEGFVRFRSGSAGAYTMEHSGTDITTTATAAINDVVYISCYYGPTGQNSEMWFDGVSQGTTPGANSFEPTSRVFSVGARATDGAVPASFTFLELHLWSDVDDISAFDVAGVHAYMAQQQSRAA